jgi:mRNA interferase MazF
MIIQGDLFCLDANADSELGNGVAHPHVVLQLTELNESRIETTVVCGVTSNLKRASEPGNVRLEAGEGNLEKASVVVVSQISVVPMKLLQRRIGRLSASRVQEIIAGIGFQNRLRQTRC